MITDSRNALESALADGGVRVLPQGKASPPSAFIIPGGNWVGPSALGKYNREVNWSVMVVVSVASDAAISEQESMADRVDAALRNLPAPWGSATINTPGLLVLGGLPYIAFRVDIRTVI